MGRLTVWDRLTWKLWRTVGGAGRRVLNAGRVYRPIFVTGAMGSGTTFLALKLARNFECAGLVLESAHHVRSRSVLRTRKLSGGISPEAYLNSLRPKSTWRTQDIRRDLLALYRSVAFHAGSYVVDKGPVSTMLRARALHEAFPEGKFVLIYRDPVVNLEGFRRKWDFLGQLGLGVLTEFYNTIHREFLDFQRACPDIVTVVRYEELVGGGRDQLQALGARLGLMSADRELRLRAPRHLVKDERSDRTIMEVARRRAVSEITAADRRLIERELAGVIARLDSASRACSGSQP